MMKILVSCHRYNIIGAIILKDNLSLVLILLLCITYFSCNKNQLDSEISKKIDIESNIKNTIQINLSEFNCDVEYIKLETKKDRLINKIRYFDYHDNKFIVADKSQCLLFEDNGRFISKIGIKGMGPKEYRTISNVKFGYQNNIYIQNGKELLEYGYDGSMKRKFEQYVNLTGGRINSWMPYNDSLFIGLVPNYSGDEPIKAVIYDHYGNALMKFRNNSRYKQDNLIISSFNSKGNIYRYNSTINIKEINNDTLFLLSNNNKMLSKYIFNLGKYKPSIEDANNVNFNYSNYIYLKHIFEMNEYLFLDFDFNKYSQAKRQNPIEKYGGISWYYTTRSLGIYNKKTEELSFALPEIVDDIINTGLYNDYDGGPNFFPHMKLNDSSLIMWINAFELKAHVSSKIFIHSTPKYPEKKKALEKLANSLNENDNPVLMLVRLKE